MFPRYPNDIKTPDIERATPRTRRSLQISRQYIDKQRKTVASLQLELRRAKKKIRNMKDMLQHLRQGKFVNQEMEDRLAVCVHRGMLK